METQDIHIRKGTKADMPAVFELITELAIYEKEPEAVEITVEDLQRDGFGKNSYFTCFVGEVNGKIEGFAMVYFRFSTWKGKTVHLEDFMVRHSMRGKGLGNALFQNVIRFAKEEGVKRTEWVVLDWNKPAISFYERTGASILKDWFVVQMDDKQMSDYLKSISE